MKYSKKHFLCLHHIYDPTQPQMYGCLPLTPIRWVQAEHPIFSFLFFYLLIFLKFIIGCVIYIFCQMEPYSGQKQVSQKVLVVKYSKMLLLIFFFFLLLTGAMAYHPSCRELTLRLNPFASRFYKWSEPMSLSKSYLLPIGF